MATAATALTLALGAARIVALRLTPGVARSIFGS